MQGIWWSICLHISLDLNPIEHKWAQAKSKKRESGCDTEILFSVHMV
ncbi:hypothetical protein [Symbiopectobacterium sp. RP]